MSAKRELMDRNLVLAGEQIQALLDDPVLLEQIPDGTTLVLLPDDDPELARHNREIGWQAVLAGRDVYFYHIRKMSAVAPTDRANRPVGDRE